MSAYQGHVKLPKDYYAKDKLSYADWRQAWFREAIQNEMDAGADTINFTIESHPTNSNLNRVICHGNGLGMDKDKLLNVFLVMGGSQKGEGSIGGFGYAKVVLAFAHEAYKIETHGIEVTGVGGDYEMTEGHPVQQGVRLTVDMDKNDSDKWSLERALRNLVHHSDLPRKLKITLNGETLECNSHKHPYKVDTKLGKLTFKDQPAGSTTSVLWVRMRGLAMFAERLYGSSSAFEGYLELEGDSKEYLTSNRDSLNSTYRASLTEIVTTLSTDREKLKLGGEIDLLLNKRDLSLFDLPESLRREFTFEAESQGMSPESLMEKINALAEGSMIAHGHEDIPQGSPFMELAKAVLKTKDKVTGKLNKIPSTWYPDNFKVKHLSNQEDIDKQSQAGEIASKMCLQRYGKLAAGWSAIVNALLESEKIRNFLGVRKLENGLFMHDEKLIAPGFVFGSPEGLCMKNKTEGKTYIMVNPVSVIEDDFEFDDIVDAAIHELTHLDYEYHGEGFTMRETGVRRAYRKEIGSKELSKVFSNAIDGWRIAREQEKAKINETNSEFAM